MSGGLDITACERSADAVDKLVDSAVAPEPEHEDVCSTVSGLVASAAAGINLLSTTEDQLAAHGSRSSSPAPASVRLPSGLSMQSTQQILPNKQLHVLPGRTKDSPSAELMQYMYWRSLQQQHTPAQQLEGCLQTQQMLSSPSSIRTTSSQPTLARPLQEDYAQHAHTAACRTDGYPASPFSPSIADIQQQLQELQALSDKLAAKIAYANPSIAQDPWVAQQRSAQGMQPQDPELHGSTSPAAAGTSSTAAGNAHNPPALLPIPNQQAATSWLGRPTAGPPQDATPPALSTAAVSTAVSTAVLTAAGHEHPAWHEHLEACSSAQASCGQLHAVALSSARDNSTFEPAGQGQQLPQGTQAHHAAAPAAAAIQAPAWPVSDLMMPAQMHTTHLMPAACAGAEAGTIHTAAGSSTVASTGISGASMLSSGHPSYQGLPEPTATADSAGSNYAGHCSSTSSLPGAFMQATKNAAQVLINPANLQDSVVAAEHHHEQSVAAAHIGGVSTAYAAVGAPSYQHSSQIDLRPSAPRMQQHADGAQLATSGLATEAAAPGCQYAGSATTAATDTAVRPTRRPSCHTRPSTAQQCV